MKSKKKTICKLKSKFGIKKDITIYIPESGKVLPLNNLLQPMTCNFITCTTAIDLLLRKAHKIKKNIYYQCIYHLAIR